MPSAQLFGRRLGAAAGGVVVPVRGIQTLVVACEAGPEIVARAYGRIAEGGWMKPGRGTA
jgi:hypothetical protein